MSDVRTGRCLCGSLRYRATGQPKRVTACHCTFCQRRTGGAVSIHAWYEKNLVQIEGDGMALYEHRSDENGHWLRLHFCTKCATTVMLTIERMPDVYLITGGTLDDPRSIDIEVHSWMRSSPPWMALPLQGQCFQTSSGAGLKQLAPNRPYPSQ
jgi:hypothetical protein